MVGLGNPGRQYESTRHNAGFLALDLLAQQLDAGQVNQAKHQALFTTCRLENKTLLLAKPQTFNSDQFPRIKIGVGAPDRSREDLKDYVLDAMDSDAYEGVKLAPQAVVTLICQGIDQAMQDFNGLSEPSDGARRDGQAPR